MKEYYMSVDTIIRVEGRNEEEAHEMARQAIIDRAGDHQIDFIIEEEYEVEK